MSERSAENDACPTCARMAAERDHWKAHAEEAGRGFAQACRDYARVSAQLNTLTDALLSGRVAPPAVTEEDA